MCLQTMLNGEGAVSIYSKYELHRLYLEDTTIEISQDSFWRKKIFEGCYDEKFLITYKVISEIPQYLKNPLEQHKLEYFVSKVRDCPEKFDNDLIIFKFEAKEFSDLVMYSGNNPKVL